MGSVALLSNPQCFQLIGTAPLFFSIHNRARPHRSFKYEIHSRQALVAMTSNFTGDAVPPPPPDTIWVAEVGPALNFIMIGATMGSAHVTMLMALFFFSTPILRRKPVFSLNVLALLLGIAGAVTNIYEEVVVSSPSSR